MTSSVLRLRTPWDGASRAPLRIILALVFAIDLGGVAWMVFKTAPSAVSHPSAPGWLLGLSGHGLALGALVLVGWGALVRFAAAPGRSWTGLVALIAAGVLVEAHAALLVGPMRFLFVSGAAMLGWLVGGAYARGRGYDAHEGERLAEIGASATLAATYVGAVLSKFWAGGLTWMPADALRMIVLSQHPAERLEIFNVYANLIGTSRAVAQVLVVLTLLCQLSALLYPFGPRLRAVAGTLLLGFHFNTAIITPLFFPQAMTLLLAFSYPWPRLWRGAKDVGVERAPALPAGTAAVARGRLLAGLYVVLLFAWLSPLRDYTRLHDNREPLSDAQIESRRAEKAMELDAFQAEELRRVLGALSEGESPEEGWRVASARVTEARRVEVRVSSAEGEITLELVRSGASRHRPPRVTERFHIFHKPGDTLERSARERVLDFAERELRRSEKNAGAEWLFTNQPR